MNFEGAFTWALGIATLCMVLFIRAVFDWDFVIDLLCSKIWRSKKLKKMMEERETILAGQGLSKEKRQAFEDLLIPLTKGDKNLLPSRMDKIFRKETENQLQLLKDRGLRLEFYFAGVSSSGNFTKWNDGGREWREAELEGAILERFVTSSGNIIQEIYHNRGVMTIRQSRRIRHDDRKEKKQQYYEDLSIYCQSCGAELMLNTQEVNCPYCGAVISRKFFDWQMESFDFYTKISETGEIFLLLSALWFFIFIVSWIGFLLYKISLIASIIVVLLAIAFPVWLLWHGDRQQENLKKQIVRYSESYLRTCINEALWQKEDKQNLLSFGIDKIKLKSVNHKGDKTYIRLKTTVSKTFLPNTGKPIHKKERMILWMERAKYPERVRNKGKVFEEKECPSCGANFMPDENNNCSYCGYGLRVYNGKWKLSE